MGMTHFNSYAIHQQIDSTTVLTTFIDATGKIAETLTGKEDGQCYFHRFI